MCTAYAAISTLESFFYHNCRPCDIFYNVWCVCVCVTSFHNFAKAQAYVIVPVILQISQFVFTIVTKLVVIDHSIDFTVTSCLKTTLSVC